MRKAIPFTATAALILLAIAATGCDKLKSRDQLNKGVTEFRNAHYDKAVDHFKEAVALDPTNPNAQEYLATAYMSQWIPGAESPENVAMANKAKEEFNKVLTTNPNDTTALASLANIAYQSASSLPPDQKAQQLDEAANWEKKLVQVDPKNKEAYYMLGVISWAKWYPADIAARLNAHMKPDEPGPLKDKKVKEELKTQYSGTIDEGIQDMQKALDIDSEYEDAMTYMNLLIREKADLLDDPNEYKQQVTIADNWMQKALDTKKAKAARQPASPGGIVVDNQK